MSTRLGLRVFRPRRLLKDGQRCFSGSQRCQNVEAKDSNSAADKEISASTDSAPSSDGEETTPGAEVAISASSKVTMSKNTLSHSPRQAFLIWMKQRGHQFVKPPDEPKTNYLDGRDHPFPLNPQFSPQAPVSESVRSALFESWQNGAGIHGLSVKFGMSLERVEAIIKLQEIKSQWSQSGRTFMTSYAKSMSSMLGAQDDSHISVEPSVNVAIDPGRQVFALYPESAEISAKDAAKELGKELMAAKAETQISSFVKRSKYEPRSSFSRLRGKETEGRLVETDRRPDARWAYKIRRQDNAQVYLRAKAGELILRDERKAADSHKWKTA